MHAPHPLSSHLMPPQTISIAYTDERGAVQAEIEYQWLNPHLEQRPLVVFLHEGLGSIAMWKRFPQAFCDAGQYRGLVFSRPGYGQSTPRELSHSWPVEYLHWQAKEMLPALFRALQIPTSAAQGDLPWLFGHSDGGSISLLYAAHFPQSVAGIMVMAPHISVEEKSLSGIRAAQDIYLQTDFREKLGRYHRSADSAFFGWCDAWLNPAFQSWNICAEIAAIRCPVLAIQGEGDEYGTMAQIDGIQTQVPQTQLCKLPNCGHSPHRDQPDVLMQACHDFIEPHIAQH